MQYKCYTHQDGSMDEERVSELCQTYSERFGIEPSQIMDTMRVICKAADPKVTIGLVPSFVYIH